MRFEEGVTADFSRVSFLRTALFLATDFGADANFHQAHFEGASKFSGAIFKARAVFSQAKFDVDAVFGGEDSNEALANSVTFENDADFTNAQFAGTVNFQGASFLGNANFSAARIAGVALFSSDLEGRRAGAVFARDAYFVEVHFGNSAEFGGATFKGKASFNSAKIDGYASFYESDIDVRSRETTGAKIPYVASFEGEADFAAVNIGAEAQFSGVVFVGTVNFGGATIGANAVFGANPNARLGGAVFRGDAMFARLHVNGDAMFQGTTFQKSATFNGADIKGAAFFRAEPNSMISGPLFRGAVDFTAAHIGAQAEFEGSQFADDVSFSGVNFDASAFFYTSSDTPTYFSKKANFSNVHIVGYAEFQGTSFAGDASFDRVRIDGSLSFYNDSIRLASVFGGVFYIREAKVSGPATFTAATFKGEARFDNSRFDSEVIFSGAKFEQNVSFVGAAVGTNAAFGSYPALNLEGAVFHQNFDFSRVSVGGDANFTGTKFDQFANFEAIDVKGRAFFHAVPDAKIPGPVFLGDANFVGAHIAGQAEFQGSKFWGNTKFTSANFQANVFFYGGKDAGSATVFNRELDFRSVYVAALAFFEGASFKGNTYFSGARIDGAAYFYGETATNAATIFDAIADFSSVKFGGSSNFSGTTFNGMAIFDSSRFDVLADFRRAAFRNNVSFREMTVRTIYFSTNGRLGDGPNSEEQFHTTADFRGCSYDRIYELADEKLDWRALTRHWHPYDRQPYTQLEKSFRSQGQDGLADQVYLERQDKERDEKWQRRDYFGYLFSGLYGILLNYGVRPIRLVLISALLISMGAVLFSQPGALEEHKADQEKSRQSESAAGAAKIDPPLRYSIWDAFGVSLRLFSPVDVLIGQRLVPSRNAIPIGIRIFKVLRFKMRPTTYATVFLQIAGWILVPLIIASITGLLKAQ
ncbi:MAG: pentapeptide repeat-containing protein [Verrucomicrobia bacterium]|nr:pentapeptide repeat-containing protein [Verrucomicrobiota bacterium]